MGNCKIHGNCWEKSTNFSSANDVEGEQIGQLEVYRGELAEGRRKGVKNVFSA